ncbi:spore coat protein YsxE [Halalkalibacterium ligniniphilum]|uniref:spore coat protein YsxE n=1 Tax=Halalkalibacterium ligniniphilum TaxID=1134413 RepID=UPI0003476D50|nr:spore coat protein YsxE [Halalkalibacterium ligniniphilum]
MINLQPNYEAILYHYDLYPEEIEDLGKIKKVVTRHGMFALKETDMTREQADWFVHCVRKLGKLGYNRVIPLLSTKFGEYTISDGAHCYYVMPWVEEVPYGARESQEEKLIDQLGIIHRLTVKTQPFSKETLEASYKQRLQQWEMKMLEVHRFADVAERKSYMSPFELTLLTHVVRLEQYSEAAKAHLKAWYDTCLEKEKYRSVLCHGRINRSHAFFDENFDPILINFERVALDTPARDLASFCRQSFPHALWSEGEIWKWFDRYEQHLPLLEEEKNLLSAYLTFPEPIVFAIEAYSKKNGEISEMMHVHRLEKRLLAMRKVQRLTQKLVPVKES